MRTGLASRGRERHTLTGTDLLLLKIGGAHGHYLDHSNRIRGWADRALAFAGAEYSVRIHTDYCARCWGRIPGHLDRPGDRLVPTCPGRRFYWRDRRPGACAVYLESAS